MPLRHHNPFHSRARELDESVNPYVARLVRASDEGSLPILFGERLRSMPGRWRHSFRPTSGGSPKKLVVEIGCHLGKTLTEMAADHPDTGFVGLDITFKRVVKTAEKAARADLRNIISVLVNATSIDQIFAPREVDGIVVFFPDPWVKKKRQLKNRLLNKDFVTKVRQVLAEDGWLWFKTDQQSYFDEVAGVIDSQGFKELERPQGLLTSDYESSFERLFTRRNLSFFEAKWQKN